MKKAFLALSVTMLLTATSYAGVTVRYYNEDSKDYKFKAKTCGSEKEVEFEHSKTTSMTIQTGCSDVVIYTSNGEVKVKDGDKIHIKNGKVEVVSSL